MTVGIASLCETEDDDSKVILSADRMVTTGLVAPIEYEHTESKMLPLVEDDELVVMGVGAGSLSFIDDFFYNLRNKIEEDNLENVREIAVESTDIFKDILHETINRQVLNPLGFELSDLKNQQQFHPQVLQSLLQDVTEKQEQVYGSLQIMLVGIDKSGGHIYSVQNGDIARHDSIGYHSIGSGTHPAHSTFISNRYDSACDINNALLSVVEAKMQAEEAQGVGRDMDIAVISKDGFEELDNGEIQKLRNIQEEIAEKQVQTRNKVINDNGYDYTN